MRKLTTNLTLASLAFAVGVRSEGQQPGTEVAERYRITQSTEEPAGPHYARARKLYELGPLKAAEIIGELDLELQENPESLKALSLKADTQIGTGEYATAMATLDRFDEITRKRNSISANGIYLRARCLHLMGEHARARKLLETYSAFFEGSDLKSQYDSLLSQIPKQQQ